VKEKKNRNKKYSY